ncbi:MAG: YeeE/YedE family protein [Bacteroidales bacterium]|nr:YeeE/YedE family protein [Bacteroidales bacterium]
MGPLVPEIISNEFNLVIAFIIGIGFGFILEQAGFSSTRKLAGLFYGYDFTVLKVFFTAGITALIGILLLAHLGLLDIDLIYINPTFLWSALIGGVIMGAGFIIGGFCPGASICAAAIGKIDAFAFIFGSILGIFIFAESYPLFEEIYKMENWDAVRIDQYFSISPELFAFLITIIAIGAFITTTQIENRINNKKVTFSRSQLIKYLVLGGIPFIIIAILTYTPDRQEYIRHQISDTQQQKKCIIKEISSDKLAHELINNYYKINLIDVRSQDAYKEYHLPLAINIPLDDITNHEWKAYFVQKYKINVFYADKDTIARKACLLARFIGKSENYVLKESPGQFRNLFFNIEPPSNDALKTEFNTYRFRVQSARELLYLENALKNSYNLLRKENQK